MTVEITPNIDDNTVRIFVIRHGQTDHNLKKILQGHVNIDVNATGISQSQKVGESLSQVPFDYFVSSDLIRCLNTSKEILERQAAAPEFKKTDNLREREMGKVQGMFLEEARRTYGDDFRNFGEKLPDMIKRIEEEFSILIKEAKAKNYKNVGVCTHGGVLTSYFNYLYNVKHYALGPSLTPEDLRVPYNTSVSIIDIDKDTGKGTIQEFGNTKHLGADLKVKNQLLR